MNKGEREELRRLLRSRFKVLRADVQARRAELVTELQAQVEAEFAASDKAYDDAMFKLKMIVDAANREANDVCRTLFGREKWGERYDREVVGARGPIQRPGVSDRQQRVAKGQAEIDRRVKVALLELDRRENELLTELATTALASAESQAFFTRIPSATDLVPAYRLAAIVGLEPEQE